MIPSTSYTHRVTHEQLSEIMGRYSDSGYTNIHQNEIIINLVFVDDEEDRQEFADLLNIPVDKLPDDGLITVHA
jgi:hypothetical protein